MYSLNPVVTKEFILSRLDQVQILEYYLGIRVNNKSVRSPLRKDNNPSCSFWANGSGTIYFKDWAQGFSGDWIKIIQYKYGLNYQEALQRCAEDFNLIKGTGVISIGKVQEYSKIKLEPKESVIQIKVRRWDEHDREYWSSYGINRGTLDMYNVYPCEIVFYNTKVIYSRSKNDLAYAYRFGTGKYKIYMPQRNAFRWISNFNSWQGLDQLPETGSYLIITKSMKDVMCLRNLGIISCAPSSEVVQIEDKEIENLSTRFEHLFSFMDFDLPGVKMANMLFRKYNAQPMFLTNGRFGSRDYRAKDISDYYHTHGLESTLTLVAQAKKKFPWIK